MCQAHTKAIILELNCLSHLLTISIVVSNLDPFFAVFGIFLFPFPRVLGYPSNDGN